MRLVLICGVCANLLSFLLENLSFKERLRKKTSRRSRGLETRKPTRKLNAINKLAPEKNWQPQVQGEPKKNGDDVNNHKVDESLGEDPPKQSTNRPKEANHSKTASQGDNTYSSPLQVLGSSDFSWAKRRMIDSSYSSRSRSSSRSLFSETLDPLKTNVDSRGEESCETVNARLSVRKPVNHMKPLRFQDEAMEPTRVL